MLIESSWNAEKMTDYLSFEGETESAPFSSRSRKDHIPLEIYNDFTWTLLLI